MRPNNFDLIRLMAAWQVVYCHTCTHLELKSGIGNPTLEYFVHWFQGVPVFFTISGFLISRAWERTNHWHDYAVRRGLRIYPALWVQLVVGILLAASFGAITSDIATSRSFAMWVVGQSTFFQFYNPEFLRGFGKGALNGSLWTIPVELGFYISLPLIYRTFIDRVRCKQANLGLMLLTLLSFAWWFHLAHLSLPHSNWVKLQGVTPLPHLYMFLLGVLAQRNIERLLPILENRAMLWLASFSAFMLAFNPWGREALSASVISVFAGRLLLAMTVLSFAFSWRSLSERLLRGNDISYGVYLYHGLAINALVEAGWTGRTWHFGLVALVTVVLAEISWRLIERPVLLMSNKSPVRNLKSNLTTLAIECLDHRHRAA